MKKSILLGSVLLLSFASCKKIIIPIKETVPPKVEIPPSSSQYVQYLIQKGGQYSDKNTLAAVQYEELKFMVSFDSTAIYKNVLAENQYDINKLYGFSDNNALHHDYSARFGWRWSDNALRLFAYVYNNGVRSSKEIAVVQPGVEYNCSIKVAGSTYVFTLGNKTITMPRLSTTATAKGYKLYPYFGGDEVAPHNIKIRVKEL